MQKIVITGSSGFIGGYLSRGLQNIGHQVYHYNRSTNVLGFSNPDIIIHCAANPNIRPEDPITLWESNIGLTHKILELTKVLDYAPMFINMSSVAVYGDYLFPPSIHDQTCPVSEYGISKLASEQLVNKYHNEKYVDGYNLRLGGICGPHMTHGILKRIINAYQLGLSEIEFAKPSPGNYMSYLHVDYLYQLIKFIIEHGATEDLNVCSHNIMNIKEIVDFFNQQTHEKLKIKWIDKPGFKNDPSIFVSKVNTPIDMPNIEESLERTIFECL